jgi:hypothetical protein
VKTVIISGWQPTYALYDALSKHYTVAVYDQQTAQKLSIQSEGGHVVAPIAGAQQGLYDKARNDAVNAVIDIMGGLSPDAFSINGRQAPDPESWLPGLAVNHLAEVVTYLRVLDAYAESDDVELSGVVTHEDVTPRFRALATWGKARGVPVIHIPHNNCFLTERPDMHDQTLADWILAASPYMRDWYVTRGFAPERIKIIGFPPWDRWATYEMPQDRARAVLNLDERPIVAFCTGWAQATNAIDDHSQADAAMHFLFQAAQREGWQVIWKLHPGDAPGSEARYGKAAASYRVPTLVTRDHLAWTLSAADVVLSTGPSNVLVEAGIVGPPPALFPLRGYGFDRTPPWEVGLSVDDVRNTVNELLGLPDWEYQRKRFVRRYAFKADGKATKRAVRQIKGIVGV